jgi:hypothetical protein
MVAVPENPAGTIDPVSAGGAVALVGVPTVEPDATNDTSGGRGARRGRQHVALLVGARARSDR